MQPSVIVLEYLKVLVWPVFFVTLMLVFRKPIYGLLGQLGRLAGRVRTARLGALEVVTELDAKAVEAGQALATNSGVEGAEAVSMTLCVSAMAELDQIRESGSWPPAMVTAGAQVLRQRTRFIVPSLSGRTGAELGAGEAVRQLIEAGLVDASVAGPARELDEIVAEVYRNPYAISEAGAIAFLDAAKGMVASITTPDVIRWKVSEQ